MADMNEGQTKLFHVVGVKANGTTVALTAGDVTWSVDQGTMDAPGADASALYHPPQNLAADVTATVTCTPTPTGKAAAAPAVSVTVTVSESPVTSITVTSDAPTP